MYDISWDIAKEDFHLHPASLRCSTSWHVHKPQIVNWGSCVELEEDRVDQGNFSAWHSLSLRQGKGHPSLKEWAFKKCFICIYFVPSPNFFQGSKSTLQSRPTVGSKLTTRQRLNILVSNRSISPVLPDCWGSTKNNVSVLMVLILCLYTSSAFSLSDF